MTWILVMDMLPALNIIVSWNLINPTSLICRNELSYFNFLDHSFSPCLAARLGDIGLDHSPVYGFSTDGFPIYGPYQASHTLAVSCWQKRDYNSSLVGCIGGERTCTLINPLDYSQGTQVVSSGPSLTSTVPTQSGNTISSACGIYKQDYFYNAT